ncbi:MAG: hypothetical protein P9L92_01020 [Candidatus Electryonea clarkiae]|nr:hypothetical protein [Candidatus Electryonea clarkiae]MDP8287255.1 hypothetical protein [Candidatus Electryonea clarkiae]
MLYTVPATLSIHTTLGNGWTILGCLGLIILASWSYRWTKPPVPFFLKIILTLFRTVALLSVWLLLTGFEVRWENVVPVKNKVLMMIDRSASMAFDDSSGSREEVLRNLLNEPAWSEIEKRWDLTRYVFSDKLNILDKGSLPDPDGAVTDISNSFSSISKNPDLRPDAVVLISDGAFNRGGSPTEAVRRLDLPVFTVAIGDSIPPKDMIIKSINNPGITYIDEPVVIDMVVQAAGMARQNSVVQVYNAEGQIMASDTVEFLQNWSEKNIRFEITPDKTGLVDYQVKILPADNEVNLSNNTRHMALRVREKRRKVALLAGSPVNDIGFLAKVLETDNDTELATIIGGGPNGKLLRGKYPSEAEIADFDAVVFFLEGKYSSEMKRIFRSAIEKNIPLSVITGRNPDRSLLDLLSPRVGSISNAKPVETVSLIPRIEHPIFTLEGNWFEEDNRPAPPVDLPGLKPENGRILAVAGTESGERPVVISSESSPRTIVFFLDGLWRWDFARRPHDPGGQGYRKFWMRTLRWLTAGDTEERIIVQPVRDIFTGGEEVELTALVRDEALRPLDDAEISAEVSHGNENRIVTFKTFGEGRYNVRTAAWGEGAYSVTTKIVTGSETIVRKSEFVVDAFHLEDTEMRMRPDRLRSIAQTSGGSFLLPGQIDQLPDLLPVKTGTETISGAWRPFGLWSTLLVIVLLLSIEWLIRTRSGMM